MKITRAVDIDKHKIVLDGCMVTYTGIIFDLMNPDADLICLEDIAHGLAFNCRWNGATKYFYSIAEHVERVAYRNRHDKEKWLTSMFHDSEEAYWGDMIKPLKEIIKINSPEVIQKMKDLRMLIFDKYKIKHIDVSEQDNAELLFDFENLILSKNYKTRTPEEMEARWLNSVRRALENRK